MSDKNISGKDLTHADVSHVINAPMEIARFCIPKTRSLERYTLFYKMNELSFFIEKEYLNKKEKIFEGNSMEAVEEYNKLRKYKKWYES